MAVICLDPGHGGRDGGAVRAGLAEKDLTLAIAQATRRALGSRHATVLTRESDVFLTLAERRSIAAAAGADFFVSIHVNAATNPRAHGYEVLVRSMVTGPSGALAAAILDALAAGLPDRRHRGLTVASLGVLRQPRPCCLVECLFLSNPEERALLSRPDVRAALGTALAQGCAAFARGAPPMVTPLAGRVEAERGRTGRRAARSPRRRAARPA